MNEGKMSDQRAGEIALRIMIHKAQTGKFVINNRDPNFWNKEARKVGVTEEAMRMFVSSVIFPMSARSREKIHNPSREFGQWSDIAFRVLSAVPISLDPEKSRKWLDGLSHSTDVPVSEIEQLYTMIMSEMIGRIMGWSSCSIIGEGTR